MKLYWDTLENRENHFEFNDYVGTTAKTKQPKWYQNIPYWREGRKSWREVIALDFDKLWGTDASHKTVKGCPAYINFFRQSIALKTPCDMFFKVYQSTNADTEKKEWYWEYTSDGRSWRMDSHPDWQGGGLADRDLMIKMSMNFTFTASEDTQFQYVDPYIANPVHYRVSPGVVRLPKGSSGSINMITFFPKQNQDYWIPAGSTLGYVQFDKVIHSVQRKDLTKEIKRKSYLTFEKGDHSEYLTK